MNPPGELIASGRDADIFEYGPGLVLRRARSGRSMAGEAKTMEYARAHGYPVPAVAEISDDGTDLVMERIDGTSMADTLVRRPWTLGRQASVLADLHHRLHDIAAPEWAPPGPCGDGNRLLHLDLHPLNVMLSARGPVVIDWTGASRGDAAVDVALTWAVIGGAEIPAGRIRQAVLGRARGLFVNSFLRHFDLTEVRARLADVVDWKTQDPNMSDAECQAMWRLARVAGEARPPSPRAR